MKKMLIAVFMLLIVGFCVVGFAASDHQTDTNDAIPGDGEAVTTDLNLN